MKVSQDEAELSGLSGEWEDIRYHWGAFGGNCERNCGVKKR